MEKVGLLVLDPHPPFSEGESALLHVAGSVVQLLAALQQVWGKETGNTCLSVRGGALALLCPLLVLESMNAGMLQLV